MINKDAKLFLASKSPRRKKLLELLNMKVSVIHSDYQEDHIESKSPSVLVKKLAQHKMNHVLDEVKDIKGIIITADTIVYLNNSVLNKPVSEIDAFNMLSKLAGNTHTVYTGFMVFNTINKRYVLSFEKTKVTFRKLEEDEIWSYIKTGSPMDKAGAYGIQDDYGAIFISKINGCYYNVVGLPLTKLYLSLLEVC